MDESQYQTVKNHQLSTTANKLLNFTLKAAKSDTFYPPIP